MTQSRRIRVSKFLSKHLRHAPDAIGLSLQPGGWVGVDDLLAACERAGVSLSRDELREIVSTNDKQRFAFSGDGSRIRASQGHSVDLDLQLEPRIPPALLFHGTAQQFLHAILVRGLLKMRRHHVHLSADRDTATKVGSRRRKPIILEVAAERMHAAGFVFYQSANGVWLVDHAPPHYLSVAE
jgi:putative RNA 2'-phosphotransferase